MATVRELLAPWGLDNIEVTVSAYQLDLEIEASWFCTSRASDGTGVRTLNTFCGGRCIMGMRPKGNSWLLYVVVDERIDGPPYQSARLRLVRSA